MGKLQFFFCILVLVSLISSSISQEQNLQASDDVPIIVVPGGPIVPSCINIDPSLLNNPVKQNCINCDTSIKSSTQKCVPIPNVQSPDPSDPYTTYSKLITCSPGKEACVQCYTNRCSGTSSYYNQMVTKPDISSTSDCFCDYSSFKCEEYDDKGRKVYNKGTCWVEKPTLISKQFTGTNVTICQATQVSDHLQIYTDPKNVITVSKGKFKQSINSTGKVTNFYFPLDVSSISGETVIECRATFSSMSTKIYFDGVSICKVIDCTFCSEMWDNFKCFPRGIIAGVTIGLILFFIVVLYFFSGAISAVGKFFKWVFWGFVYFLLGLLNFVLMIFTCGSFKTVQLANNNISLNNIYTDEVELKDTDRSKMTLEDRMQQIKKIQNKIKRKMNKSPGITGPTSSFNIAIVSVCSLLLFSTVVTAQLSPIVLVDKFVPLTDCVSEDGSQTCTINQDILIDITESDRNYTFFLTDNNLKANCTVYVSQPKVQLEVELLYYTSDFTLQFTAVHHCYDSKPCSGSYCSNLSPYDTTLAGLLSTNDGVFTSSPGLSSCDRVPGCISNGCFLCDLACVFSRFVITPEGEIYQVFVVTATTIHYDVQVFINDIEVDQITIQNALFSSQPNLYNGNKLIASGNKYFFTSAADPNNPVKGNWGEIQSSTIEGLNSTVTPTSFIFDNNIAIKNAASKTVTYSYIKPNYTTFDNNAVYLPSVQDNGVYYIDNQYGLTFRYTENVPMTVIASVNMDVTGITEVEQTSCPKILSQNITGCYDCVQGANLELELMSTCGEGETDILANSELGLLKRSLMLSSSPKKFNIPLDPSKQFVDTDIVLMGRNKVTSQVHKTLNNHNNINNRTIINGQNDNNSTKKTSEGGDTFNLGLKTGFYNDLLGWVIVSVSIIAFIVIALIILYCVFQCVMLNKMKKS